MDWGNIISIVFAVLSFVFSIYTYKRTKILEDYKISEYKEKAEAKKKANITGYIAPEDRGLRCLNISNNGQATAHNIRIEGLDIDNIFLRETNILPYKLLNPQENFEISLYLTHRAPATITIKYLWDDDYMKDNSKEQILQL